MITTIDFNEETGRLQIELATASIEVFITSDFQQLWIQPKDGNSIKISHFRNNCRIETSATDTPVTTTTESPSEVSDSDEEEPSIEINSEVEKFTLPLLL